MPEGDSPVYAGHLESRPFITVVSGLPRSGTSMMMQMLAAGGMPPLTDGVRAPDEDNPRGYFEFEAVKRARKDSSWVSTSVGKAVKMVPLLLRDLPPDFDYRVILMRRDPSEVLESQKAMLQRLGRTGAKASDETLKELFQKELERTSHWLAAQLNFRMLTVDYRECICYPAGVAGSVNAFLDGKLDPLEMAGVVDATLYRKKVKEY
jgi:hypothetical protein